MSIVHAQSTIAAGDADGGGILAAVKDPTSTRVGIDQTVGTVYGSWASGGFYRGEPVAACWTSPTTMEVEINTGSDVGQAWFTSLFVANTVLPNPPDFTVLSAAAGYNYSAPYARWTWGAGFGVMLNGSQYRVVIK